MAASYTPHQPQRETAHRPIIGAYGYPLQDQGASAHCPPPPIEDHLPQSNPPETDLPPAYPALEQKPPPAYDSEAVQLTYNFQPQPGNNTTVVVTTQPMTAATTGLSLPEENDLRIAICAFVFSICILIACGASVICLYLSIPAVMLSIAALKNKGGRRSYAKCSICLNGAVVVCSVFLLLVVTPIAVTTASTRYCSPYYSTTYRTYCVPHSSTTRGSCTYYAQYSYKNFCPN